MAARLSGIAVAYTTAGFVLLWSGIKNVAITTELKDFLKGQVPPAKPTGPPTLGVASTSPDSSSTPGTAAYASQAEASAGGGTVSGATEKANQAIGEMIAASHGWTGAQWAAFNSVALRESGWDNLAKNSSSGAFGIAQALGHGTAGTAGKYGNAYGGYGVPDSTCQAANDGEATPQIEWMCAYIEQAYGTPEGAWNSEQTRGYY